MNRLTNHINRQYGNYFSQAYDCTLARLMVHERDDWRGIQPSPHSANSNPEPPIFASKFSKTHNYRHILALANEDGKIAIQDTTKQNTDPFEQSLPGEQCHNNAVFDLEWMPHHMKLVSASGDYTAQLWELTESKLVQSRIFTGHERSVKTAAFRTTDASVFATGGRDGAILIWDIRAKMNEKAENRIYSGHAGGCGPSTPQSVRRRHRSATPNSKLPPNVTSSSITGLAFQDDNTLISCGAGDGIIKVWDLRRNYSLSKKEPYPKYSLPYAGHSTFKGFTNLSIDKMGRRLYVNCMDNHIYCYNIATFENSVVQTYRGFKNGTFYIKSCLSPDDQYLISGSSDERAYIWNVDYADPVAVLNGHTVEVTCVAWSKIRGNEDCVVTCSEDARHKIWRLGPVEVAADEVVQYRGSATFSQDYRPSTRVNPRKRKLPPPLDFTPKSIKRLVERNETTPSSIEKQPPQTPQTSQTVAGGTKRSFADMCDDDEEAAGGDVPEAKRPSQESRGRRLFAGSGGKNLDLMNTDEILLDSPETRRATPLSPVSPRNYRSSPLCEKIDFNVISPETPSTSRASSLAIAEASTSAAATAILFSPTTNLPNFVVDRQAPHLRIISPKRKLKENVDWLTKMRKQKILSSASATFNAKLSGVALSPRLEALKTSERSPRTTPKRRLSRSGSTHTEASPKGGSSTTPRRNSTAESTILRFLTITTTASSTPTSSAGPSSSQSTSPTSTPVPPSGSQ